MFMTSWLPSSSSTRLPSGRASALSRRKSRRTSSEWGPRSTMSPSWTSVTPRAVHAKRSSTTPSSLSASPALPTSPCRSAIARTSPGWAGDPPVKAAPPARSPAAAHASSTGIIKETMTAVFQREGVGSARIRACSSSGSPGMRARAGLEAR
ncbi:MAG: hypothetical protein J3K34DRAFT_447571 [Monoraphidium minutum]|nr:MAG: hypothetical protein J3K34DRAFT_447571 [Monoraphidium minutum]